MIRYEIHHGIRKKKFDHVVETVQALVSLKPSVPAVRVESRLLMEMKEAVWYAMPPMTKPESPYDIQLHCKNVPLVPE